jgi:hypothetical protein
MQQHEVWLRRDSKRSVCCGQPASQNAWRSKRAAQWRARPVQRHAGTLGPQPSSAARRLAAHCTRTRSRVKSTLLRRCRREPHGGQPARVLPRRQQVASWHAAALQRGGDLAQRCVKLRTDADTASSRI